MDGILAAQALPHLHARADLLDDGAMAGLVHPILSAAVVAWLREHDAAGARAVANGLDLPADGVPIERHRALLERAVAAGGERALLQAPRHLLAEPDEPLVFAMLNSDSIDDLIDKEQRLNRYFHSHHRVRVIDTRQGALELEHHAQRGAPPARIESLFVLGVHLALLEELGCRDLRAQLPASERPDALLDGEPPPGDASRWRFEWRAFEPTRRVLLGLDEILVAASAARDLAGEHGAAADVRRVLERDLARRWTLADVARLCHTSTRSLQRRLTSEGTSFRAVLDRARVDAAARMLADPASSVTETGYACGFADTAHFSRRFKAVTGKTPSSWRSGERPATPGGTARSR